MPDNPLQILLVDDDPAMQRLLRKWLESAGYVVKLANDGRDAQQRIADDCPQLLITDWEMPNVDGLGLCRWLRQQQTPNYIYTIFLTCRATSGDMITALESGADDFIKKPVEKGELLARVRSAARMLELESRLSMLARTDPLTGLMTRRTFVEMVEREWARSSRHKFPLSCVMIDIDYFKRINDTHGHRAGDHALQSVAKILQQSCRTSDIVGRYGGEEFCVLLPETTEEHAVYWAERVRRSIASTQGLVQDVDVNITASFGVAQRLADTRTPEELVDLADQALLVAKRSGRDRVLGFQSVNRNSQGPSVPSGPAVVFQNKTAGDVMATIVAGLKVDDTVGCATRYFLRFRSDSAPVVDQDGKLVGILSERDVMSIMLLPNWWHMPIKEVMRCNVVCYGEETPVQLIYEFLCRVLIRGVFIVRDGRPVGMISRASLLRWLTNSLAINPATLTDQLAFPIDNPSGLPVERCESVAMIAHAIRIEADSMELRLRREPSEIVPVVVSGVSRIEELINELLSYSRNMGAGTHDSPPTPTATSEVTHGLSGLLASGSLSDA